MRVIDLTPDLTCYALSLGLSEVGSVCWLVLIFNVE